MEIKQGGTMKDPKQSYGVYVRSGMLVSLIMTICAFVFVPTIEVPPCEGSGDPDSIIIVDPFFPIEPPPPQPPPVRPPLPPVAVIGDGSSDNVVTIGQTIYNDTDRVLIDVPVQPYWQVQILPKPLKTPPPNYPSLPLQAGIEGTCVIKAVIDTLGNVVDVKIYKSSGNRLLDDAALTAFRSYQFKPAVQHDRPVSVWIRMPITFKLN